MVAAVRAGNSSLELLPLPKRRPKLKKRRAFEKELLDPEELLEVCVVTAALVAGDVAISTSAGLVSTAGASGRGSDAIAITTAEGVVQTRRAVERTVVLDEK